MLKAPVPGRVKTRLAREIGPEPAARAYRALVEHQWQNLPRSSPARVCYDPPDALPMMQAWLGQEPTYAPQAEGDLGERLRAAVSAHFQQSTAPVVVIGGDCPYLGPGSFEQVTQILTRADAALVPAADGGYCLIGLCAAHLEVFREITWSTDRVLEQTRARLRSAGLRWEETAPLEDVDDRASWERALQRFPHLAT